MQLLKTFGYVAIAVATVAMLAVPAAAQDAEMDAAKALLAKGIDLYNAMEFAEAKGTLLKIDPAKLPSDDSRTELDSYLNKVDVAARGQIEGLSDFRKADELLKIDKYAEAEALFTKVLANPYVPGPVKKDATSMAALAVKKRIRAAASKQAAEARAVADAEAAEEAEAKAVAGAKAAKAKAAEETKAAEAKLVADAKAAEAKAAADAKTAEEMRAAAETKAAVQRRAQATADAAAARRAEAEAKAATVPPVVEAPVVEAPVVEPPVAEPPVAASPVENKAAMKKLRAQAAQIRAAAEAARLVEHGSLALEVGGAAKAADLFRRALELAPDMDAAARGLQKAMALQEVRPSGSMSRLLDVRKIKLRKARVDFDQAMVDARTRLQTVATAADFVAATERVRYGQSILETNKQFFPANDYLARQTQAAQLLSTILTQQDTWQRREVLRKRQLATQKAEEFKREQENQRSDKIQTLVNTAKLLESQQKWDQALEAIDEILRLDPQNPWGQAKQESLRQFELLHKQSDAYQTRMYEEARQLVGIEWDMIPWYEMLRYPKDWAEITRRRVGGGSEYDSEANREARRKLQVIQPRFEFDELEFESAVEFIRDYTKANIVVNWNALEINGIDRNTPVTLMLTSISSEKALEEVLTAVGGVVPLGYVLSDGVVKISTKDDLATLVNTHVYDIHDLIVTVPNFIGPVLSISQSEGGGGDSGGGSSSGGGFGDTSGGDGAGQATLTRAQLVIEILDMVRSSIDPDSWIERGGVLGSIRELNGQVVITQTPENHRRVLDLFSQLRESQAVQVNIEARFITVSTGFLNDVGVSLNFFLNTGSLSSLVNNGLGGISTDPVTGANIVNQGATALPQWANSSNWSNKMTPIGMRQNSLAFTQNPQTSVPNSIGLQAVGASGLSLAGTFLDDIQVDFLIKATQADSRSTNFLAPRLTLSNGQRAFVLIGQEQAYVSDLEPVQGDNVALFNPTVSTIVTGNTLDVEATVSADRRYVTLTMRPQVSNVREFFQYSVSNTTVTTSATTGTLSQSGVINLPVTNISLINTTVTVPDGGTLLIGGQRISGEVTREMGVPILNKIPIINRLFSNRSTVRDEQTVLILIKPTIIINREYEEDLYPM